MNARFYCRGVRGRGHQRLWRFNNIACRWEYRFVARTTAYGNEEYLFLYLMYMKRVSILGAANQLSTDPFADCVGDLLTVTPFGDGHGRTLNQTGRTIEAVNLFSVCKECRKGITSHGDLGCDPWSRGGVRPWHGNVTIERINCRRWWENWKCTV